MSVNWPLLGLTAAGYYAAGFAAAIIWLLRGDPE